MTRESVIKALSKKGLKEVEDALKVLGKVGSAVVGTYPHIVCTSVEEYKLVKLKSLIKTL